MANLRIINHLSYPVFDIRDKENNGRFTTTFLTVDDKHPAPLIGIHSENDDNFVGKNDCVCIPGEIKITKKENSKYNEFFVDFMKDAADESQDELVIIALPIAGIIKEFRYTSNVDNPTEPLKARMAKYGKQDVPVKIIKKDGVDDGTWGFDKILYLVMKSTGDFTNLNITIEADHCGRTKNENGKYEVTTREYTYYIDNVADTITIEVKYIGRHLVDERPVGISVTSIGNIYEINPFVKKTADKPNTKKVDDNKPREYSTDKKHEFVNKPRFKNNGLKIPSVPEEYGKKKNNGRKKGHHQKKSKSNYDY